VGGFGLDSSGSGEGPVVGCCEHGNELPVLWKEMSNSFCRRTLPHGVGTKFVPLQHHILVGICWTYRNVYKSSLKTVFLFVFEVTRFGCITCKLYFLLSKDPFPFCDWRFSWIAAVPVRRKEVPSNPHTPNHPLYLTEASPGKHKKQRKKDGPCNRGG
jgi:hypothetical protein